jgi:hypothetical protein
MTADMSGAMEKSETMKTLGTMKTPGTMKAHRMMKTHGTMRNSTEGSQASWIMEASLATKAMEAMATKRV